MDVESDGNRVGQVDEVQENILTTSSIDELGEGSCIKSRPTYILWLLPALGGLADFLFYDAIPGCSVAVYFFVLGLCVILLNLPALKGRAQQVIVGLWLGNVMSLCLDFSFLGVVLGLVIVLLMALTSSLGWSDKPWDWIWRVVFLGLLGWFQVPSDFVRALQNRRGSEKALVVLKFLLRWLLPVILTLIFLSLFITANPMFEKWYDVIEITVTNWCKKMDFPSPMRIMLWAFWGVLSWCIIRAGARRSPLLERFRQFICTTFTQKKSPKVVTVIETGFGGGMLVRCLVLFNILFLVQNLLDIGYLWSGAALPEELTYAEYSHRGAYPLVATALLAAAFVLVTFRNSGSKKVSPRARNLVFFWLGQNVFLTASSLFRLDMYVDAYKLSLFRVAAAVWMVLVVVGLVVIFVKIAKGYSNSWLCKTNLAVLFTVLYLCSFVNFRAVVADFNVAHCREISGEGVSLDVYYLDELGYTTIPALKKYQQSGNATDLSELNNILKRQHEDLAEDLENWRGWTYTRYKASK